MHSIVAALTWEYCRRGYRAFLLALSFMIGIPAAVVYLVVLTSGPASFGPEFSTLPLHFNFLTISFFGFGFVAIYAQNGDTLQFPARLFTLPLPAWLVVGCRILQGMATVSVLFLLTAMSYELLFDLRWPKLGPALFLTTGFVCLQAVIWSMRDFRFWKLLVYVPVGVGIVFWLSRRYAFDDRIETAQFWNHVTLGEFCTMAACAVVAYALAVRGMVRARRGDATGAERIRQLTDRVADLLSTRRASSESPEHTLLREEWRRNGIVMPIVLGVTTAVVLLVGVIRVMFDQVAPHAVLKVVAALSVTFATILPFGFGFLHSQNVRFNSRLPVSDVILARTLLTAAGRSVLVAWLVCAALLLPAFIWVSLAEGLDAVAQAIAFRNLAGTNWSLPLVLVVAWIGSWTLIGLAVSLSLIRRAFLVGLTLEFALVGCVLCLVVLNEKTIGPEGAQLLRSGFALVFGSICLVGTAWALVAARRHQLVTSRIVWAIVIIWIGLCASAMPTVVEFREATLSICLAICGALALPLLPFVAVPLAVRRHRHH